MEKLNIKKEEYFEKIIDSLTYPACAQISALESFLSMAGNKISQDEKDIIELTLTSCKNMKNLIETYTLISNPNVDSLRLNCEKFNITNLVKDSINDFSILFKYHNLNISFEQKEKIVINADKSQIKKVIENLLFDSINRAFENNEIKISIYADKNYVNFKIESPNPYINESYVKSSIDKYSSSHFCFNRISRKLGLHLSKKIISAHFGVMIIENFCGEKNILGFQIPQRGCEKIRNMRVL